MHQNNQKIRHPFSIEGSTDSNSLTLIAKLVCIYVLCNNQFENFGQIYISFIPELEKLYLALGLDSQARKLILLWRLSFFFFSLLIVLGYRLRIMCSLNACLILCGIIFSQTNYSNNALYVGILFLIIALSPDSWGPWAIRIQLAVLYFGAGIDKLLAKQWQDGSFFISWKKGFIDSFTFIASDQYVAIFFSWATIITEFFLSVGSVIPGLFGYVTLLGGGFHLVTTVVDGNFFGVFVGAVLISYISFFGNIGRIHLAIPAKGWASKLVQFMASLDADKRIEVARGGNFTKLTAKMGERQFSGLATIPVAALHSPGFLILLILVFNKAWVPYQAQSLLFAASFGFIVCVLASQRLRQAIKGGSHHIQRSSRPWNL